MKNAARRSTTGIIAANPTAFSTALEDHVCDRVYPPVATADPLAFAPPIADAAREIRRNWTAGDRISRATWAFARSAKPQFTSTRGVPADIGVEG